MRVFTGKGLRIIALLLIGAALCGALTACSKETARRNAPIRQGF